VDAVGGIVLEIVDLVLPANNVVLAYGCVKVIN
jgi:hypothetical protein